MCSYLTCNRKFQNNSQKIQKILEHTIIASFEAKICWERPIKRENKKKSFQCVSTRPGIENSKQIAKKF